MQIWYAKAGDAEGTCICACPRSFAVARRPLFDLGTFVVFIRTPHLILLTCIENPVDLLRHRFPCTYTIYM